MWRRVRAKFCARVRVKARARIDARVRARVRVKDRVRGLVSRLDIKRFLSDQVTSEHK